MTATRIATSVWLALALALVSFCQAQQAENLRGTLTHGSDRNLLEKVNVPHFVDPVGTKKWTYDFVQKLAVGFNLTLLVKDDFLTQEKIDRYNTNVYQSFQVWDDWWNDRTAVAKQNDVCYLAIRGQERHLLFDVIQTLLPFVKENAFGSGCSVKRSFYYQYSTGYADQMLAALDTCAASCGAKPCEVVLHGHSTAAASVSIAALDPRIKKHNPTIIAMAPLRGIISEDCQDVDLHNVFRIVAVGGGIYDGASSGRLHPGTHYGKFFMVDEQNRPFFIAPTDNLDREPETYALHGLELYSNRMQALASIPESEFPLKLSSFPTGHWCHYQDECESGTCGSNGLCSSSKGDAAETFAQSVTVGSPCSSNGDCTSGICMLNTCALANGLMAEASPCQQHTDCHTQYCDPEELICLSQLFEHSFCTSDAQCEGSLTCTGPQGFFAGNKHRCAQP